MSFTDFIRLQNDFAHMLLCDEWLANVNVVTRERILADQSRLPDENLAAEVLAYITPRNNKVGCGVIVEKPELTATFPNVPGPQGEIVLTCLVLEDPLENEAVASGTLRPADQVGQKILDIAHHWTVEGTGIWAADAAAMTAARDWEPLRAYRVRLRQKNNRGQTDRVARVSVGISAGTMTLTCATAGAAIRYVLSDTKFPGASEPTALLYSAPVSLVGTGVVRAAAWKTGMIGSAIARKEY